MTEENPYRVSPAGPEGRQRRSLPWPGCLISLFLIGVFLVGSLLTLTAAFKPVPSPPPQTTPTPPPPVEPRP